MGGRREVKWVMQYECIKDILKIWRKASENNLRTFGKIEQETVNGWN